MESRASLHRNHITKITIIDQVTQDQHIIDIMEDRVIDTVLGTFIIENFGDNYDVATNIMDGQHFYRIPKGLSEQGIKEHFKTLQYIKGIPEFE